jgi:hypothetical protein
VRGVEKPRFLQAADGTELTVRRHDLSAEASLVDAYTRFARIAVRLGPRPRSVREPAR